MKLAILYETGEVCVEFPPDVFLELLRSYIEQYGDVETAFAQIEKELHAQTRYN